MSKFLAIVAGISASTTVTSAAASILMFVAVTSGILYVINTKGN